MSSSLSKSVTFVTSPQPQQNQPLTSILTPQIHVTCDISNAFHVVGWQWMPMAVRVGLRRRQTYGWRGRTPDPERARVIVSELRLMTRRELRGMFPDAKIIAERFFGPAKSWVVVGGFGEQMHSLCF
jgi:hypothetical protein